VTLLERIFGKSEDKSKSVAKDRLKLVLMRQEIIAVIAKYVEINEADLKVDLERADTTVALVANIPIRRVRG
jgi:cell division topological specificity factor